MRHPGTITCDFCKQPIDMSTPWTTLQAVVPNDVGSAVLEQWKADAPKGGVFGFIGPLRVPTNRLMDMCNACEADRLPDLRALTAVITTIELEEQRKRAQRPNAEPQLKDDD